MTTKQVEVRTGFVTTEGDDLYYEVRGHGQPLLMIPGGGGDAGFYSFAAEILSDEYKVITYDRRGNSRSTRNDPQNFEISQQSRDAVAVIHAAGESSAFVFGNSGGAVIALDMAKTQPQAVKAIVVHEPPVLNVLPDHEKWLRLFAGLYRMSFIFGAGLTMLRFGFTTKIPMNGLAQIPREFGMRMNENQDFFIKHEMLPFTNYMPDSKLIQKNNVRIFMAAGQWTLDKQLFYGLTAPVLAEQFGCELVIFPGHHVSYIDMPDEWAATLRSVLHRAIGANQ